MKCFSRSFLRFSLLFLIFLAALPSRATSYMGADLTYYATAPGVYRVNARLYRDCSGPGFNATETLTIQAGACNAGRTIQLTLITGTVQVGTPYCSSTLPAAACNPNATLPNYESGMYQATIAFTATEMQCPDWNLSLTLINRSKAENLAGTSPLYTETYLNLRPNIHNNSVEISPSSAAVLFSCKGQEISFNVNANDPDGDSLSYELVQPLAQSNTPVLYNTIDPAFQLVPDFMHPVSGQPVIYNRNIAPNCSTLFKSNPLASTDPRPLQLGVLPAVLPSGYSAGFPIYAYNTLPWAQCQTNIPLQPMFEMNPATGTMQFTPQAYVPNTSPADGRNKYAVSVLTHEWRRISGQLQKVGSTRRELTVVVNDCANLGTTNSAPFLVVLPPHPLFPPGSDSVQTIQTCQTTRFVLQFRDHNPLDLLDVKIPGAVLSGNDFIFPGNGGNPGIPGLVMKPFMNKQHEVNVAFYMTPTAGATGLDYFLRTTVEDNGCPLKARTEQVIRLHIAGNNRVTVAGLTHDRTINLGQSTAIDIINLRPDSIQQQPAQYAYHWTDAATGGLPDGLNPADQYNKNIVVSPTQTTRYLLTVTSSLPGCADTTSVLVRVNGANSVRKDLLEAGLSVFPNPFSHEVNFTVNGTGAKKQALVIYSVVGREIDRIALSGLPAGKQTIAWERGRNVAPGPYLVRVVSENGSSRPVKFIKLR